MPKAIQPQGSKGAHFAPVPGTSYHPLTDDSALFGMGVGYLSIDDRDAFLSADVKPDAFAARMQDVGCRLLSVQVNAEEDKLLYAVQKLGFRFVDCRTRMKFGDLQADYSPSPWEVRDAVPEDVQALETIAYESFHDGRFISDPEVERDLARARYVKITRQCINGHQTGDSIWVLGDAGAPKAFIGVHIDAAKQYCELKLAAVASNQQGKGYGKRLFRDALARLRSMGIRKVEGQISPANTAITNIYLSLGFLITPLQCMFHLHLSPGSSDRSL